MRHSPAPWTTDGTSMLEDLLSEVDAENALIKEIEGS